MNRVYKVIYSRIRHCYVVVSELAHRQRKEKSAHASILPAAAAAALIFQLGLGSTAMAAVVPSGQVPTNSNNASASGAVNIEKTAMVLWLRAVMPTPPMTAKAILFPVKIMKWSKSPPTPMLTIPAWMTPREMWYWALETVSTSSPMQTTT